MIVHDASVWVSVALADDPNHDVIVRWVADQLTTRPVFAVPTLFVAEIGAAISRRPRLPEDAQHAVAKILHGPMFDLFPLVNRLANAAAHFAIDLGLRGADSVYVALAHRLGLALATMDREQAARASAAVPIEAPT